MSEDDAYGYHRRPCPIAAAFGSAVDSNFFIQALERVLHLCGPEAKPWEAQETCRDESSEGYQGVALYALRLFDGVVPAEVES